MKNNDGFLARAKSEIAQQAEEKFPDWQDGRELYCDVFFYAMEKIVNSDVGGEEFFNRLFFHEEWYFADDMLLFFDILKDEFSAYQKINEMRRSRGYNEINDIIEKKCHGKDWQECLTLIQWSDQKIKDRGSDKPYFEPEGDFRYRVNESIKLWVMNRDWDDEPEKGSVIGVVDEIERVILVVEGRPGEFVRYNSELHSIRNRFEFSKLIAMARRGDIEFFSNLHRSPDYLSDIIPKEFICQKW